MRSPDGAKQSRYEHATESMQIAHGQGEHIRESQDELDIPRTLEREKPDKIAPQDSLDNKLSRKSSIKMDHSEEHENKAASIPFASLESVLASLRTSPDERTEVQSDIIYSVLSQTQWFSTIPPLTRRQMSLLATIAEFDPKTEVEKEGELSTVFFVVLFGSMSVYRRAGKKRRYISTIGRGATVGEPELDMLEMRSGATVVTEMPSVAIAIDRKRLNNGRQHAIAALHRNESERSAEDVAAILQCIKAMAFFRQLTEEAQAILASTVGILQSNEGDAICRQGEKGNTMYVLLSGSIQVLLDDESGNLDKRKCVGKLGAGDSFGELALIEASNRRNATCICETDVELITISKPVFKAVLNNNEAVVYKPEQARTALSVLPGERTERDIIMIMDMVKKHKYFADLEDEVKSILAKVMTLEIVETGQVVFEQGTRGDCLYVILSGSCTQHVKRNSGTDSTKRNSALMKRNSVLESRNKVRNATKNIVSKSRQDIHGMNTHIASKIKKNALKSNTRRRASIAMEIGMQINATEEKAMDVINFLVNRRNSLRTETEILNQSANNCSQRRRSDITNRRSSNRQSISIGNIKESLENEEIKQIDSKYGEFIGEFMTGDSFGENALSDPSSRRATTVVSDSRAELLVIQRYTYDRFIQRANNEVWSEHVKFLSNVPVLRELKRSELLNLLYYLTPLKKQKGEIVMREGERVESIYFVRRGTVTLTVQQGTFRNEDNLYLEGEDFHDDDDPHDTQPTYGYSDMTVPYGFSNDPNNFTVQQHSISFNQNSSNSVDTNGLGSPLPLVTLGPGEFFGEESIGSGIIGVGVISSEAPLHLFELALKDLSRMPSIVRDNIAETAKLRRRWRQSQRSAVIQMKQYREKVNNYYHNNIMSLGFNDIKRAGSIVEHFYNSKNKKEFDGFRKGTRTESLSTCSGNGKNFHVGLAHEMNVDVNIDHNEDDVNNSKDNEKDESKSIFTSSLLSDVVNNSWTIRVPDKNRSSSSSSMGGNQINRRPATAHANISSQTSISHHGHLQYSRRDEMDQPNGNDFRNRDQISESGIRICDKRPSSSGPTLTGFLQKNEDDIYSDLDILPDDDSEHEVEQLQMKVENHQMRVRPGTAGAVQRSANQVHLSYGIPTKPGREDIVDRDRSAKGWSRRRPMTALGHRGTKINWFKTHNQSDHSNQIREPRNKINTLNYENSSDIGHKMEEKKGLYTQRQHTISIHTITPVGRLFL